MNRYLSDDPTGALRTLPSKKNAEEPLEVSLQRACLQPMAGVSGQEADGRTMAEDVKG